MWGEIRSPCLETVWYIKGTRHASIPVLGTTNSVENGLELILGYKKNVIPKPVEGEI